jgi:hypothetical protein
VHINSKAHIECTSTARNTTLILLKILYKNVNSGMKSKSIAYLLSGSAYVYWILGVELGVHAIWVLWTRQPSRM